MIKKTTFLTVVLSVFITVNVAFAQMENENESKAPGQSYSACGCGCCEDIEPRKQCLYHSEGDDLEKIIEEDQKAAKNPACPNMGCNPEIQYSYCD